MFNSMSCIKNIGEDRIPLALLSLQVHPDFLGSAFKVYLLERVCCHVLISCSLIPTLVSLSSP